MKAVLDAAAFVAAEKRDASLSTMLRLLQRQGVELRTSSAVVAQVWRDGSKQVRVARLLAVVDVRALGSDDDKRTGELLAKTRTCDVVDAHLALLVDDGDVVFTSDRSDLARLLDARGVDATLVDV